MKPTHNFEMAAKYTIETLKLLKLLCVTLQRFVFYFKREQGFIIIGSNEGHSLNILTHMSGNVDLIQVS